MPKLIYIIFGLIISNPSLAYEVNIYDASEPNKSVIEVVDDCNYSHKLIISTNELNNSKVLNWVNFLLDSNKYCKKNIDS